VEILASTASLSFRGHGHVIAAAGRDGGADGRPASCTLHPDSPEAQSLPSRFAGVALTTGDRIRFERGGGGGLGDARKRPPEAVIEDVRNGYVSRESAVRDYGLDAGRLP
jgi:N-methylhydantoinase B